MYEDPVKESISWMRVIFLTVLIVLMSRHFLFEPVAVHGESMMPTFEDDDKVVLMKIYTIENFDMIVFTAPNGVNFIKRVIGVPGDRISMEDDQLFVNGRAEAEPYLDKNRKIVEQQGTVRLTEDFEEFTVPAEFYYVLGDNRLNSMDSRVLGFISEDSIVGEVKVRLSPLEHVGIVE
ncbi:signal peptidase I S [Planococcus antarcticus DSM 14505]|uniref:Signal peptidase I n=1 Tax=Planococcus antarcticus DSM 14505 TaxID=1185653 RepID=A0AA87IN97_9BACL|nr:signal peptidase I [Planococcus antarcticus]EIM07609.1 signal peptidase I S [Planococcus antarcticus DSM 14505]